MTITPNRYYLTRNGDKCFVIGFCSDGRLMVELNGRTGEGLNVHEHDGRFSINSDYDLISEWEDEPTQEELDADAFRIWLRDKCSRLDGMESSWLAACRYARSTKVDKSLDLP